jgi:fructose-1,6-bisphosphatase/inositol monophosphatase family enzyme
LWDTRVLGCSTLEFAFVAAGLLSFAFVARPKVWDVVAGLVLLEAAGCHALSARGGGDWDTLLYFDGAAEPAMLARWSEPVLLGDRHALERARSARSGAP